MLEVAKRAGYTSVDDSNFEEIYLIYFHRMLRFAREYVANEEDAENIVQDVFMTLWERRGDMKIHYSLVSYLLILCKNRCIDHLRREKHVETGKKQMQESFEYEQQMKLYSLEALDPVINSDSDLEGIIIRSIDSLPPKCREIFLLHKIEGKKYREIAEEMHISVSTVENQMSIALRKLREMLKNYLQVLLFLI